MSNSLITKQALAQSLKELTKEQSFDKISVADVTAKCGINRQTFYYHFTDKFELLDWIYYTEAFVPLTQDISFENWSEKLYGLLILMKKDRLFYLHTIKCSNDFFEEYLYKMLVALFEDALTEIDHNHRLKEHELHIYARFFSHGLCGTIIDWALGGMKEDERELSRTMYEMVAHGENIFVEIHEFKNGEVESIDAKSAMELREILHRRDHKDNSQN